MINDDYIIKNCLKSDNSVNPNKITDEVKEYLHNRFKDIPEDQYNYLEPILRILYGIDKRPVCPVCGKSIKRTSYKTKDKMYSKFCSKKCGDEYKKEQMKTVWANRTIDEKQEIQEKSKQSCLERFGVEYSFQSENNKQKAKETLLRKYGTTDLNKFGSKSYKENMIKKYGTEYPQQTKQVRKKISKALSSKLSQEKMQNTCIKKYGYRYVSQIPDIKEKINQSFINNGTYNSSKDEKLFFDILKEIFNENDIICQYFSDDYPFSCDFYIKPLNLYIELNCSFFHNKHLYNPQTDRQELLNLLKKCSVIDKPNRYDNLIDTWVIRDIKKWEISKENKLNMLFIYPYFYEDWIYYKSHINNNEIKNNIIKIVKTIIEKYFINKNNIQIIYGEYREDKQ